MKWIRYPDLVAKGIVNSRMTLKRLNRLTRLPSRRLDYTERKGVGRGVGRRLDRWPTRSPKASTRGVRSGSQSRRPLDP
jgi:hypothetical protein